jgi:peptidoglycan hydrolase CwlO-like protein
MKIIFLTENQEKEIAKSFKKKVKIIKKLDPTIEEFCRERYKEYFNSLKREIKKSQGKIKKTQNIKKFPVKVGQNICFN